MAQTYDALLAFGTAVNEETLELPAHVYDRLDRTATLYEQQRGDKPLVIVSGFQRSSHVYKNNLLRDENGELLRECDPMAEYLAKRYGITALREPQAASLGDNMAYSKLMLMSRPFGRVVERICIVTLEPLQARHEALACLIFGNFCDVEVDTIPTSAEFRNESKFFGDQVCMLKDMPIGDHWFIINEQDGSSLWPELGRQHNATCQHFVPDNENTPFTNAHPEPVMDALLEELYRKAQRTH